MTPTSIPLALAATMLLLMPAHAQTTDIDAFKDAGDEAKVHSASGFVCPLFIGHFERDAYGERDPSIGADFCAYSALDGVYGTITLTPLKGIAYDPKTALVPEFTEQEGIGGKMVGESTMHIGGGATPISVYTRTYETAALETLHYRILFSGGTIGAWALEATVEFATPRDDDKQRDFLKAVYDEALAHIAKQAPGPAVPAAAPVAPAPPAAAGPLAGPTNPR
ncbi:MAG TPA: hypothetical protein VNU97_19885 [Rhizomicrobium sp.]|jgi:hypothetical protein|nr:hypothetical protein [Rhizomicrobium sp.]